MKFQRISIFILFSVLNVLAFGQNKTKDNSLYDTGTNLPKFITTTDSIIKLHILEDISDIEINENLTYYWFTLNQLHKTKGGYSGKLLNGLYQVFNTSNDLIEQGDFENGLKSGKWTRWDRKGQITELCNWKAGLLNGETLAYNAKGKLESRLNYVNGELNGKSFIYNSDSSTVIKRYNNGKLTKTTVSKTH